MITVKSKELHVFKSMAIENPLEYYDQTPCEGSATFHSVHRTCHSIGMKFACMCLGLKCPDKSLAAELASARKNKMVTPVQSIVPVNRTRLQGLSLFILLMASPN